MSKTFELSTNMQPLRLVTENLTMAQVTLEVKPALNGIFAVVDQENHPRALLRDEYLPILRQAPNVKIGQMLDRLPALITVDANVLTLDQNHLKMFTGLLYETQAPGVVVLDEGEEAMGMISRGAIIRAYSGGRKLIMKDVPLVGGSIEFSRFCSFVCNQCDPPAWRMPLDCDVAPLCPRFPLDHGAMQPA